MNYVFHPNVLIEFSEAALYYSEKSSKLGLAFYAEVENPKLFRVVEGFFNSL